MKKILIIAFCLFSLVSMTQAQRFQPFRNKVHFKDSVKFEIAPVDLTTYVTMFNDTIPNDTLGARDTILWTSSLDLTDFNAASIACKWDTISDTLQFNLFESINDTLFTPAMVDSLTAADSLYGIVENSRCNFYIMSKTKNYWRIRITAAIGTEGRLQIWAIKQSPIGEFRP